MDRTGTGKLAGAIKAVKRERCLVRYTAYFILPMAALILMLSGCATAPAMQKNSLVMPGDQADVQFTCLLKNGEVAISTYQDVSTDPSLPKSTIFLPRDRNTPIKMQAGTIPENLQDPRLRGMEGEVVAQLAKAVVGLPFGERRALELKAENMPETQKGEHIISISRVRQRPKELRFTPAEYEAGTGHKPEVGRTFVQDPALPGKIVSVTENEVVVRFSPGPGTEVYTPFGKGVARELSDHNEIVINAVEGSLVRSAGLVGKITKVDDKEITIDYSNVFGGDTLRCEVLVEPAKPEAQEKASSEQPASPPLASTPETERVKEKGASEGSSREGGPATAKDRDGKSDGRAKDGDLVVVNYTASLEDGSLVYTTQSDVASDKNRKRAAVYAAPVVFAPEEMVAGKQGKFPGVAQTVVGMAPGEKRKATLPPGSAFGPADPKKIQTYGSSKTFSKEIRMTPAQFFEQFQIFPVQGKEVQLAPFLKALVTEIREVHVVLQLLAKDGDRMDTDYGFVDTKIEGDQVTVTIAPRIGAMFKTGDAEGRIVGVDAKSFTVDYNSPLAQKAIILEAELVSFTPTSSEASAPIAWIEDHDAGLAKAKESGKPSVLLLYAGWCGWCKKFLAETVEDPRIKAMRDRFVWVKVNSDKYKDYQTKYQQNGFPLILILSPDGQIARRIDGFVDAGAFQDTLASMGGRGTQQPARNS